MYSSCNLSSVMRQTKNENNVSTLYKQINVIRTQQGVQTAGELAAGNGKAGEQAQRATSPAFCASGARPSHWICHGMLN